MLRIEIFQNINKPNEQHKTNVTKSCNTIKQQEAITQFSKFALNNLLKENETYRVMFYVGGVFYIPTIHK